MNSEQIATETWNNCRHYRGEMPGVCRKCLIRAVESVLAQEREKLEAVERVVGYREQERDSALAEVERLKKQIEMVQQWPQEELKNVTDREVKLRQHAEAMACAIEKSNAEFRSDPVSWALQEAAEAYRAEFPREAGQEPDAKE